jgi:hypothetical protein
MGQDYNTRKTAKKLWKKHASAALAGKESSGVKRIRKKRNAKRRLCQGMCHNDPALTDGDKKWNGRIEENSEDDQEQVCDVVRPSEHWGLAALPFNRAEPSIPMFCLSRAMTATSTWMNSA